MDTETSNKRYFYSNTSKITGSPYDISVIFERSGAPELPANFSHSEELKPVVVESLEVSMSPSHAKAVATGLLNSIVKYESTYGSIPMPQETKSDLKDLLLKLKVG